MSDYLRVENRYVDQDDLLSVCTEIYTSYCDKVDDVAQNEGIWQIEIKEAHQDNETDQGSE